MAGYKKKRKLFGNKKNNPDKTHYRSGKTPKSGKPFTISEKDLKRVSFSQDYDDKKTKEQQDASEAIPMHNKYFAHTEQRLDKKSETDLSGTETNEGSPLPFLGTLGVMKGGGALVKGIKNRDQFGGGLKGALKGTGDALTSGGLIGKIKDGVNKRNEEINAKLDTIIAAVGGGDEGMGADTMSTSPGAAPLGMASPAKFKEFMTTTQQSPVSNNTGGKKSTFDPVMADRMMAVADPETNTKDLLFMLGGDVKKKAVTKMTGSDDKSVKSEDKPVKVTNEGIKAGDLKIKPYGETGAPDPITGYTKNKGGVQVNLANLPVKLKVGFDQKNTGYKSSITPNIQIGGKFKIKEKTQEKPKHI